MGKKGKKGNRGNRGNKGNIGGYVVNLISRIHFIPLFFCPFAHAYLMKKNIKAVLAWSFVGIPLLWGLYQTVIKSLALLQ